MADTPENIYDNLLVTLRGEFIDEAEESLNNLELKLEALRAGKGDEKDAITQVRRVAHSLKGSSGVADFPLVTIVMHKLEDYLDDVKTLDKKHLDDIQIYLDKAREFSSVDVDQRSIESSALSRQLPEKRADGDEKKESAVAATAKPENKIQALMVTKEKTAGMLFERELRAVGLSVTTVRSSFQAIEMTVRTKPDIIFVSVVLDELTGVDIAAAISAMPTTKTIPIAILTSFERGHGELEGLPTSSHLVQKNHLKDDLAKLLKELKFT